MQDAKVAFRANTIEAFDAGMHALANLGIQCDVAQEKYGEKQPCDFLY